MCVPAFPRICRQKSTIAKVVPVYNVWLMFFAGNRSHAIPLFVSATVLPLNMLYFDTVCSLMHDISTNSAPQSICDLFTCSYLTFTHTVYNTRFFDAGNLYINKSKLRIQLNCFSIFGAKLWNCLKPDLR